MAPAPAKSTTTRQLRENLRETLAEAAEGTEIVVTLRGKPYVRLVPISSGDGTANRYPLRGSVRFVAEDFDAPMPEVWDALQKKAASSMGARPASRAKPPIPRASRRKK